MITNSVPWKIELLKIADRLEKRKAQRRWTEQTGVLVERDVMVGAYALRKLLEAQKISDSLAARKITVIRHPLASGSSSPDSLNRYFVWENYDLDNLQEEELSLRDLCNQIVHSWNWMVSATEQGAFNGVFVSSDRMRQRSIYFISVDMFVGLLRAVGSEDIVAIHMERDTSGQMRVVQVLNEETR